MPRKLKEQLPAIGLRLAAHLPGAHLQGGGMYALSVGSRRISKLRLRARQSASRKSRKLVVIRRNRTCYLRSQGECSAMSYVCMLSRSGREAVTRKSPPVRFRIGKARASSRGHVEGEIPTGLQPGVYASAVGAQARTIGTLFSDSKIEE